MFLDLLETINEVKANGWKPSAMEMWQTYKFDESEDCLAHVSNFLVIMDMDGYNRSWSNLNMKKKVEKQLLNSHFKDMYQELVLQTEISGVSIVNPLSMA